MQQQQKKQQYSTQIRNNKQANKHNWEIEFRNKITNTNNN